MTSSTQSKVHDVQGQANAWFSRLNSGEVSSAEQAAYAKWRLADPAHAQAYDELSDLWGLSGSFEDESGLQDALADARNFHLEEAPVQQLSSRFKWFGAVAAVLLLTVAGLQVSPWFSPSQEAASQEISTAFGEQRTVALSDGSLITLNTDTQVLTRYTGDRRRISLLQGQALFEVADDPLRPFVVEAGKGVVTVLGTTFDVIHMDGNTKVTVLSGGVEVAASGKDGRLAREKLSQGEQVLYGTNVVLTSPAKVDLTVATSWKDGRLIFEGTPLDQALDEVNRYASRKIVLQEASLNQLKFTGVFNIGDTEGVVTAMTMILPLEAIEQKKAIVLKKREP